MSEKRKKNSSQKMHWEEAAAEFEAPGTGALKGSRALSAVETRRLLGPGRTKLVSIRVPETDLEAVKEIAEKHGRKYQHLMTLALCQFIERYVESASIKKLAKTFSTLKVMQREDHCRFLTLSSNRNNFIN